jgi:hypothetical protein
METLTPMAQGMDSLADIEDRLSISSSSFLSHLLGSAWILCQGRMTNCHG